MARRIRQILFVLIVVYAAAIGAFAFFRYDAATRPGAGAVLRDFHVAAFGWIPAIFSGEDAPDPAPGALPPPKPPPPAVAPAAPPTPTPTPEDERTTTLRRVRGELLPEAERGLAAVTVAGEGQNEEKAKVLGILVRARDLLNTLLDVDPQDREAYELYKRCAELRAAVMKR